MEKINNSIIRNEAGKDGLILGLVTILFMLASQFAGKIDSPAITGVLGFFLWLAKFLGCIFLMRFFMKKLVAGYDGVIGADTFRLGVWVALFSALICSAFTLINMLYISPDSLSETFDQLFEQMGPMLDSNSQEALTAMEPKMPVISFFTTLVYCFLFGVILSAILSKNIPKADPFAEVEADDDDDI
ncbi:MAG: DUF4199 domain-containing protein [Bacteroidales bacterium]|nr:DUF4199 domain-containing protein [Bacteroidales bacterium]